MRLYLSHRGRFCSFDGAFSAASRCAAPHTVRPGASRATTPRQLEKTSLFVIRPSLPNRAPGTGRGRCPTFFTLSENCAALRVDVYIFFLECSSRRWCPRPLLTSPRGSTAPGGSACVLFFAGFVSASPPVSGRARCGGSVLLGRARQCIAAPFARP